MAGLGKTRGASSYGKKPKTVAEKLAPTPAATKAAATTPPPSHSGGTSGELTIPGYTPETPTGAPYSPSEQGNSAADFAAAFAAKERKVQHAEERQKRIVDRYVTKAYSPKQSKAKSSGTFSLETTSNRVKKAKGNVSATREKLLSHPAVQKANEEGKVVGPKGLHKLSQPKNPLGPKGPLTHPPIAPPLAQTPHTVFELGRNSPAGSGLHRLYEADLEKQLAGAPNTLETLGYASIGIPGIGVGGDIAKLGELAVEGVPKLLAEGGAKQAVKDVAGSAGARAAAAKAAVKGAPSDALDALKALPKVTRELPSALRGAAKDLPSTARTAARAAPGAAGRGALNTGEKTLNSMGGLAVLGTAHKAGLNIPGGALLEGTGKALQHHPLETLETTGRALPGFFTAPEALGEAAVESALQGSTKPLTNTVGAFASGTKEMAEGLLSSNPQEVEKTIRTQTGLTPYLPVPAVLRQFHGSDLYTGARGKVRSAVEDKRSQRRTKTIEGSANDGLTAPKEKGRLGTHREKNALRPPVAVPGTGEHYVFRGIGQRVANHQDRAQQALDATRASDTAHGWNQIEMNRLRKAAHGAPPDANTLTARVKGRLKGEGAGFGMSPLAKDMGRSYDALVPVLAKYGLPHSPEGVKLLEELKGYHGAPADITRPDKTINDRIATNEGTKRPEILADKRHQNLTNELRAGQKRLTKELPGNYEPKPWRIQSDFTNHLRAKAGKAPILKDTERVTKRAEEILGEKADGTKWHRDEAWEKYENLKASESKLRREARDARGRGDQAQADALYKQARETAQKRKSLYSEISKFARHPGKIDTSRLPGSGRAMKRDFVNEQRAAATELGLLEPVHIHDEIPRAPGSHSSGGVKRDLPGRVTHFSTGEIARSGEADARFENVYQRSAIAPRTQIALNDLIKQSVNDLKTPVRMPDGSYKHIATEAERKWAEDTHHMPAGTEWFPTPLLKAALNGAHDLSSADALRMIDEVRSAGSEDGILKLAEKYPDLRDEILGHNGGKGLTYTAIRSAGMDELVSQLKGVLPSKLRAIANVPSRLVLNDPAWVLAQLFATGIPIAAALGPSALLRAPRAIKAMSEIQKMDPASQARVKAMIGSSAGVLGTPHTAFSNADPYAPARAIKHSGLGSIAWRLANGDTIGKWDRWNASKMREFSAAVRASKGFKNWYGGVKGLDKGMRVISEATKGMSASERLDWISRHPKHARDLQKNLNKIGGNWNSFTKTERAVAPFAIFYPWIRYSTDWVLHVFPVNHPVAATALAFLAQRNSNELQKLAAAEAKASGVNGVTASTPLDNILAYSNPVHRNAQNKPVENPSGSRMSPLGVFGQTVLEGNLLKILGATNPLINTGVSIATNTNTFTGAKLQGHGLLGAAENAAEQALSLSPLARQVESAIGFRGFNPRPQSATSKAYEILAGGKGVKNLRSFGDPYLTRPASKGALENALNTLEKRIGTTGHSAQTEVQGDESKTVQQRQKEVAKLKKVNKAAWAEKEKLLLKIGGASLAKQSQEEYERYTASGEEPGSGAGIYGAKKTSSSIYGPQSGSSSSIYGSKNSKALQYKPPSESLHLPGLPAIPGLSGVTGALTSLVGGEAAQAAEPKGKQGAQKAEPKKVKLPNIEGFEHPDQKEFAQWFSRYTGIPPKLAGEWVKQEGGGYSNGGEAGPQNWLGVRYPAEKTPFSESHFQGTPKQAAKESARWLEGKLGAGTPDEAASTIQGISALARSGAPEQQIREYIEGPSGWGTGAINTGGSVSVNGSRLVTADLSKGQGNKVYVRADAKGMVQWAKNAEGTQEGSSKQLKWATNEGLGSSQPWCANFVSNGLTRRGVPLPPNPNYVPSYESEWTGGKNIGTDLSKAKPGDLVAFSGEHIGLYVGNGEMISGNYGNQVARSAVAEESNPLTAILRPKYKGGKVAVAAGQPLPGSSFAVGSEGGAPVPAGIAASAAPAPAERAKSKGAGHSKNVSPLRKLAEVERIFAGQAPTKGVIPGFEGAAQTSTVPDLAAIGKAVEESRKKLLAA